ncbi:TetR/AcrR family transcriptional regulator [Undibacterium sp. TJN25]|uniref:TetR/AcrR family transcriptional regulator n=1 Tax=Undibacterium sp. TJN25 TaxID=3413056 RepID=UPI003BF152E2
MGRPKKFSREGVLEKVIPVFWEHGFAGTRLPDLELASGVNKSGLYSEFKDKEDLFLASLSYYLENRGGRALLFAEPLGWDNIDRFLRMADGGFDGKRGCFSVNSMREFADLPTEAQKIVAEGRSLIKALLIDNIRAAGPKAPAETIAEMVLVFFSGICIEQNLDEAEETSSRKIDNFMQVVRSL